jgi:DNA-binding response OmpR family regulator
MNQPAIQPAVPPVLVIEDEVGVMAYVRATLERSGYAVVCASSGEEGIQQLETGNFLGVHAWISRNRPDLASRIVFITGDIANEETVATLRRTGAPCVEKPFRVQQFIDVVEKTIGKAP